MTYDTYSDLVNALEKGFLDINGKTNGNITGENAEKMASFTNIGATTLIQPQPFSPSWPISQAVLPKPYTPLPLVLNMSLITCSNSLAFLVI